MIDDRLHDVVDASREHASSSRRLVSHGQVASTRAEASG
jgi:hypothetical protein